MKTILKIMLGVVLGSIVLIGGCAVVVGASVDKAAKDTEKASASAAQVDRIKHGMRPAQVHRIMAPAKAQLESSSDTEGLSTSRVETFDVKDGGKLFGKSVTVFYSNGHVNDVTKTDLGA